MSVRIETSLGHQTPAVRPARKPAYQVDPRSAEKWPSDDQISSTIKQVLQKSQISDEDKQRAFSVGNWYARICSPQVTAQVNRLAPNIRLEEVIEVFQSSLESLDPSPNFDFSRFGSPDRTAYGKDIDFIVNAIGGELLVPNNVVHFNNNIGLILNTPEVSISNSGRLIPIYQVEGLGSQVHLNPSIASTHIIEPTSYLAHTAKYAQELSEDYACYEGRVSHSPDMFDVSKYDQAILTLIKSVYVKQITENSNSVRDELLLKNRLDSIEISDPYRLNEVKLGQRLTTGYAAYIAKLIIKPTSYLLETLEKRNVTSKAFPYIIMRLRINCLMFEWFQCAALDFIQIARHAMHKSVNLDMTNAGILFAKMFGPYIHPSLEFTETTHPNKIKDAWLSWLKKNLRGNKQKQINFIQRFSEDIKAAATKILDEHFYRDLNDVIPGFVDVDVPFKGWSEELGDKLNST